MRKLAYGLNISLVIGWLIGLLAMIIEHTPGELIFVYLFIVGFPIINILGLTDTAPWKEQDLFSLYLERKKT
jgi:hypothetical protein